MTKEREAPSGRALRITGLVVAGAGIAALAVGTGFALHARSLSDQLQQRDAWNQDTYDAGRRADKIAITGFISGGVLIGAGAVLYWRGHASANDAKQSLVAPSVSAHSVGLVLLGQWP